MTKNNNKIYKASIIAATAILFNVSIISYAFASSITPDNVIRLINEERTNRGIPKLKIDNELNQSALLKAKDMINRDYFEHYAFGLTPWDFIKLSDYNYLYAGENLAMDFNTAEGMVKAWMSSPEHRDNILSPDYTESGIGIVKGEFTENGKSRDTVMVANTFGRKKPTIIKIYDSIARNIFRSF